MSSNYKNKEGGLIKMIILIIVAIAILSYFRIDIKDFFTSEQFQKNLGYVLSFIGDLWSNYLAEPVSKIWGIWLTYVWNPLTQK